MLTAAVSGLTVGAAHAAPPRPSIAEGAAVTKMLAQRIDGQKQGTGAAVAIVRPGALQVAAYGVTRVGGQTPPGSRNLFQIASLTKVFTALLLADAARRGELALDDPLGKHLPGPAPAFEGRAITLLDLATHTSGLPLRPASRADRGQDNPYAGYSHADLHADLAAVRLTRTPGSAFEYSNFDYALLGDALAHRLGAPYADLLRSRVLGPLHMADTGLAPSAAQRAGLVQGYDVDFKPAEPWDFGALAPAGGLYSTLLDLGRLLGLFLGAGPPGLVAAARAMGLPDRPGDGPDVRMGLGWRKIQAGGRTLLWSNGNGGGVRSFMAVDPGRGKAVAAFINRTSSTGVDDIGLHVLDEAQAVDLAARAERAAITLPAATLDRYVGTYEFGPGDSFTVERSGDGLVAIQGQGRLPLSAETATSFFVKGADVTFEFAEPAADGRPAVLILHEKDQSYRYRRKP